MITGTKSPMVGKEEFYGFNDALDIFNISNATFVWNIWKKNKSGSWINITQKPEKRGQKVSFKFGEKVVGVEFKLQVYKSTKKLLSNEFETKLAGEIFVIPKSAKTAKIDKVILFNQGAKDPNKASYKDSLVARAYCLAMFNQEVEFRLWEDDAAGGGHNATINKNNQFPQVFKARVNEKGIAEVKISLLSNEKVLRAISDKYLMNGDKSEGASHEFYVTASYNGRIEGASQVNVDVASPSKQPKRDSAIFPGTSNHPEKSDKEKKVTHAYFINSTGNPTNHIKVGDTVRIRIKTNNMIGEYFQYIVWEKDRIKSDDIFRSKKMKIISNSIDTSPIIITREKFNEGIDANFLGSGDPDKEQQQYFIEIIPLTSSAKSVSFGIDDETKRTKVDSGISPAIANPPAKPEKENGEKCPRCTNKIAYSELREIFKDGDETLMKSCLPFINKYFEKFKINTCAKKAHFFAQVRVETDFIVLTEILKYSYTTLFNSDLKYYKGNTERCKRDAKQEKPIGNNAYGSRFTNRPNTDDGYNFRGRGLIMVTGRSTYEAFQKFYDSNRKHLGLEETVFVTLNKKYDEEKPEKLAEPVNGVLSAVHYWISKNLNSVVENGKVEEDVINLIVDAINKKTSSRDKRRASYQGGIYIFKEEKKEYKIGTKKTFKVDECLLYKVEKNEKKPNTKKAPWMPFALGEIGQKAILGKEKNNPRISEYFNSSTNGQGSNEETNWCGAFTSWCMAQAGYTPPPVSCRAAMWQFWKQDKPIYGSAAVIDWKENESAKPNGKDGAVGGSGHITFVLGISKDGNHYYCVGGNQGGTKGARTVKISKYSKSDIDWFVIPPNYEPEADEYELKIMTSEADVDSSSTTRS